MLTEPQLCQGLCTVVLLGTPSLVTWTPLYPVQTLWYLMWASPKWALQALTLQSALWKVPYGQNIWAASWPSVSSSLCF